MANAKKPLTAEQLQELLQLSDDEMEVLTDLDNGYQGVIGMLDEEKRELLLRNRELVWDVSPMQPQDIWCCDLPGTDTCHCYDRTWRVCPLTGKGSVAEKIP